MSKKAFILTLDAAISVIILLTLLTAANSYTVKIEKETLSNLQLSRTGDDTLKILEKRSILKQSVQESNSNLIKDEIETMDLPKEYKVIIKVKCKNTPELSTGIVPINKQIITSKIVFPVIQNNNLQDYCIARSYIWQE